MVITACYLTCSRESNKCVPAVFVGVIEGLLLTGVAIGILGLLCHFLSPAAAFGIAVPAALVWVGLLIVSITVIASEKKNKCCGSN